MSRTLLWLVASVALASLASLADGAPLKVMSASNLLRVGTAENIFVECQDCTGANIDVEISVMNHPAKSQRLTTTSVTLSAANNFQQLGQITIPAGDFSMDASMKQFVFLQAQFPDQLLEKVVLVSFQSGYIFIQTDKTLYTPNSKVLYRMFAVTPRMQPVERDDAAISIEIVTPEGTILPLGSVPLTSGIHSRDYQLAKSVSPGLWKVVTKFDSNPQQSYSAEFEVKEYVLPGFEVKLTPWSSFFYVDSEELTVNIKAVYLFGKEVNGTAYVLFGVMQDGQKKSFPSSLQRVQVERGNGVVTLKKEHITKTFPNIHELVGTSIFVAVSVLTESGSEMVEAEVRSIQIVKSPYTLHLKKTPKYFKPGMAFIVAVEVVNPDGSPAQNLSVVVDPGQVQGVTAANGIIKLTINTVERIPIFTITARTNDPAISSERQASASMVALPYTTPSNNYINIGVDTAELKLGDNLKINLNLNRQESHDTDITYLILSKGQLVSNGRYRTKGQVVISLTVPVTKEMLPSFRILAYYHTNGNEVVSDSVWVDVKDSCMGSLKLESANARISYEPRKMFLLKVTGDPDATVGLVVVDKGVYVRNNKHRLTQKKVWDIVEKYDTGCTPGGGKDGMSVFYDAGLMFQSDTGSETPYRTELKCPAPSRRKRATTIMDVTTSLSEEDEEDDYSYMDSNEIVSRTNFPESWLWFDIKLPACPPQTPHCDTTSLTKHVPLQDSITTWQFTGISLSQTHGICVGDPLEVFVWKEFFVDLKLPYSAVRGEQVEVKAILHNHSDDPATVRVDLINEEHVCSAASKRGKYHQEVRIGPQTTRSVPFVVIPMKIGQYHIEVKAAVKDSSLHDGIRKMLRVLPEGVLVKSSQIITLNPSTNGVDGKQEETLNSGIPKKDLVRDRPTSIQIYVTGRENVSGLMDNPVRGNSMGSLIYRPSGSGESNMIHMTLPVIAATYLDKTKQWETVGFQKRNEALQHIKTGYQNQLAYRKNDGSFAVSASHQRSTWLTAYVAKVFAMASSLVEVQSKDICDAITYLIGNAQQPGGLFRELGKVFDEEMIGDVRGADSDASMTAFCLIAMQESRTLCNATVNTLRGSIDKAVTYLERRLPSLTNPYAVAMTSYALANEDKLNQEILYKFVSLDLSHWPTAKGRCYTLEATAYALLALVKAKAFEQARPVARWFNKQQKVGGGYGSTQATIIVYQAIAEYWASTKHLEYDLNVDIMFSGRSKPDKFNFNRDNHSATRTSRINDINQNVTVTATGSGEAMLTMVSLYYALPKEEERDCQKFNISVQLLPERMDEDEKIYKLKIEILYKDKDSDASMSILDIGLLTGFTVNTNDLDLLSQGHSRTIAKYEMNTALSERGSLIIYLEKVSHTQPEELTFRVHQKLKVGALQPAPVSVYEYYDQTRCVKFYHPEREAGMLMRLCRNDECTCAEVKIPARQFQDWDRQISRIIWNERKPRVKYSTLTISKEGGENCSMQKKDKVSNDERNAKVCETKLNCRIDFVYKVGLEEFREDLSTDIYKVRVLQVIKEGSKDVGLLNELRTLLSYPHCREPLDLKTGKNYLIMGACKDIHRDDQDQSYLYILGERTWIEYWPTDAECQTDEHRPTCLGMEGMAEQYRVFGCRM